MVNLVPQMDGHHLLVSFEEELKVSPKKIPSKIVSKKTAKELGVGSEKRKWLSKFDDVFDVDYFAPLTRGCKKAKKTRVSKY